MFSTFARFSVNMEMVFRSPDQKKSDSESQIESLQKLLELEKKRKELQQEDRDEKSSTSKKLGGDTNQMIFGAMAFAFLVIATMAVVASGASPFAVAFMGVLAAGVGGALVAKAVKKFKNIRNPQGNKIASSLIGNQIEALAKQAQDEISNRYKGDTKSVKSSEEISAGGNDKIESLAKQLRDTRELFIESKNETIKDIEKKIMENAKEVLGEDFKVKDSKGVDIDLFKNQSGNETFGNFLLKLKDHFSNLNPAPVLNSEPHKLKELIVKCDDARNTDKDTIKSSEQRLIYGALKDIFKGCKDGDKKEALKEVIGKGSTDKPKAAEVTQLIGRKFEDVKKDHANAKAEDKKINEKMSAALGRV